MAKEDANQSSQAKPISLQLSDEEVAVLRECRFNSTVYRGVPLGTVCAIFARELARRGRPGRSSTMYWVGAFAVGFYVGTASYKTKCFEKIMQLENSNLAEQVREYQERKGQIGGFAPRREVPQRRQVNAPAPPPPPPPQPSAFEMDSDLDSSSESSRESTLSFDDIRERHRQSLAKSSSESTSNRDDDVSRKDTSIPKQNRPVKRNKYGDPIWE
ncbi:OCIA domain-containing protein 1-like [Oscarella lobularis]|uniref:OCIA domain-containing protein 1-like n=1 Tax=Oscarella lobularis TaxID=121494 RepID=UPI0033144486